MTKSYADLCLERAEKATLTNDLKQAYKYQPCGHEPDLYAVSWDGRYRLVEKVREDLADDVVKTWDFFIHARSDVPELARRLKRALAALKNAHVNLEGQAGWASLAPLVKELEAPPEGEG